MAESEVEARCLEALDRGDHAGAATAEVNAKMKAVLDAVAGGRVLPGLVKRREAERALCEGRGA